LIDLGCGTFLFFEVIVKELISWESPKQKRENVFLLVLACGTFISSQGPMKERCLVIALRPQTPKHIRGGWSHYTDTSEPVDGEVGTLQL
jgi:hypothetical protein